MRAWILDRQMPIEDGPLELAEIPRPNPKAHEIRVKVSVCGICRTDLHIAEGDLPLRNTPLVLGHEIVGVVDGTGEQATRYREGDRVGISWLGGTCGVCRFCRSGRENYCPQFRATGWDLNGGFAEYAVAHEDVALSLRDVSLPDEAIAPLMCPGIAGHCAFRLANVMEGDSVGLYGFGPTAYYALKVSRHLGIRVYVSSRSEDNLERARRNGAVWAGDTSKTGCPTILDGAVVFPPAGPLVESALKQVKVGGVVVLAPVSMSRIEIGDYSSSFWGRDLRTLYNVNMRDAKEFMQIAASTDLSMGTEVHPFTACQDALIRVRHGKTREPNAVLRLAE